MSLVWGLVMQISADLEQGLQRGDGARYVRASIYRCQLTAAGWGDRAV